MRILWYSKDSPHLFSAYGKIADELVLKRLSKHHKCALFVTVPQLLGCLEAEDVVIYPGLREMNGTDVFFDHYKDFKADIYVTASDVWIFRNTNLVKLAKEGRVIWVPWCVTPDTQIRMVTEDKALGFDITHNRLVESRIFSSLRKVADYPMYQITTRDGHSLILSGNHLVLTQSGWKRTEKLKKGDLVYCDHGKLDDPVYPSLDERRGRTSEKTLRVDSPLEVNTLFSTKVSDIYNTQSPTPWFTQENRRLEIRRSLGSRIRLEGDRVGLSGRIHRRRGNHYNNAKQEEAQEKRDLLHSFTRTINSKYPRRSDKRNLRNAWTEMLSTRPKPQKQTRAHPVLSNRSRLQNLSDSQRLSEISQSQEEGMSANNDLHRESDEETIPWFLRRRRHKISGANKEFSTLLEASEISKIERNNYSGYVYDLHTETANYFANGILVHNCYIDYQPTRMEAEILAPAVKVAPTSRWLENELKKLGLQNVSEPIFLGINQDIYKPWIGEYDSDGKEITKERLKLTLGFPEDSFVIGMVQMNQPTRKPWEEQLHGIQIFQQNNPDVDVRIYAHTIPRIADGFSLPELALQYGFDYQKHQITFADFYTLLIKGILGYDENRMAKIYNSIDCLLNATSGESPGMPVLEAQSVGTPVIGTDYTAFAEFIKAGYCAKVLKYVHSPTLPWVKKAVPDPYSIADYLEKILNSDPEKWLKVGPEAVKEYTWENTLDGWLSLLADVESEIESKCLRVPTPSEKLQKIAEEIMVL